MPTVLQIQKYRDKGLTFAKIGLIFGITRQRIHTIYTGYLKVYRKTKRYKQYHRHYEQHLIGSTPRKFCEYCQTARRYI